MLAPSQTESVVVVCELAGAQKRFGHPLPGWSPWQLECQQLWTKIPLVHSPRLKRLQISLPLGKCVALSVVGVLGLTGGPKRAAIGTRSQKDWLVLFPPDRLFPVLKCEATLLDVELD